MARAYLNATETALIEGTNRHLALLKQKLLHSPKKDVISHQVLHGMWGHLHPSRSLTQISEKALAKVINKPWKDLIEIPNLDTRFNNLNLMPLKMGVLKDLNTITSQELRNIICPKDVIQVTKSGLIMTPIEAAKFWGHTRKITNVKLRNDLLRMVHGDVFYKDKLYRQGRSETPNCEWCDEIEDLEHKIFECHRVKTVWQCLAERGIAIGVDLAETIQINTHKPKIMALLTKSIHMYLYNERIITPQIVAIAHKVLQATNYAD